MKKFLGLLCVALLIVSCSSEQVELSNYDKGIQAAKDGQYEKAIDFFSIELKRNLSDKDKAANLCNIGFCFGRLKDFDKELEYYNKSLEIVSDFPPTLFALGKYYYSKKDLNKALEIYEHLVNVDPEYGDAYSMLASIQNELGNEDAAIVNMQKAKELQNIESKESSEQEEDKQEQNNQ